MLQPLIKLSIMKQGLLYFCVPFLISLIIVPLVRRYCHKLKLLDFRDLRKRHIKEVPRLGGIAIYLGFWLTFLLFNRKIPIIPKEVGGLFLASTIIFVLGIYDDLKGVTPKKKFLIQSLAVILIYSFGYRMTFLSNPLPFGPEFVRLPFLLDFFLTFFWIVGITNAFNLIDGIDGLAAGVSLFSCLALALASLFTGHFTVTYVFLILAGSSLGFLLHNFPPASIFMGDSGSLFLGFMIASLSIKGLLKGTAGVVLIIPIIVLFLPIIDTLLSIFRRKRAGKPLFEGDRGHIHYRLTDYIKFGPKKALLILYGITIFYSSISFLSLYFMSTPGFLLLIFFFVFLITFLFIRKLGYT